MIAEPRNKAFGQRRQDERTPRGAADRTSSMELVTAELPIFALTFVKNRRPESSQSLSVSPSTHLYSPQRSPPAPPLPQQRCCLEPSLCHADSSPCCHAALAKMPPNAELPCRLQPQISAMGFERAWRAALSTERWEDVKALTVGHQSRSLLDSARAAEEYIGRGRGSRCWTEGVGSSVGFVRSRGGPEKAGQTGAATHPIACITMI